MRRALMVVALGACQHADEPAPTCAAVTAHVADVMRQGRPEMGRVLPQDIAACEARELTAAQRRCLVAASSLTAIASCHAGLSPDAGAPVVSTPDARRDRDRP